MITLIYKNSCDLGGVYYAGGFENKIILDTIIVKPEYTNQEEGTENDGGVFVKEFESLIKVYKFEIIAPENIANALTFMALHDDIRILTDQYQSQIRNVKVNVNWEDSFNDCMALIEVSFQQDDQIVKSACCS
jgi:hypothetical protein